MPSIKNLHTNQVIEVRDNPKLVSGVWECGDQRFTDPSGTEYTPVVDLEKLTPMTFYLAFTPAERIAIKSSTDVHVKEFWDTYQLAVQLNKDIDPNLISVKEGVSYLAIAAPNGPGILASNNRVADILAGIAQ